MTRVWQLFLVVLVLSNTVGLGLVYWRLTQLSGQFPTSLLVTSIKNQAEISAKLNGLQSLLATGKTINIPSTVLGMADLLPEKVNNPTATASASYVSVGKDVTAPVQVYKERAEFSAVLGQLVPDYKYPYYSKMDNWYLVSLTDGKTGWVKAADVTQVP